MFITVARYLRCFLLVKIWFCGSIIIVQNFDVRPQGTEQLIMSILYIHKTVCTIQRLRYMHVLDKFAINNYTDQIQVLSR